MIADTVTTRTEIVIFVWVSRIEVCDKMIPEKRFDASLVVSIGKLISMIGREFQRRQIRLK